MIRKYFRYLFCALVETNLIKYIHLLGLQSFFFFSAKIECWTGLLGEGDQASRPLV